MRWHALILVAVGALAAGGHAQDKGKDEPKTVELNLLEKNEGANFGDWIVWRHDEGGAAIFLVNTKTGYALYLRWSSNGWINYRDKAGEWYVLFSKKEPAKQKCDDLPIAKILERKRPAVVVEEGKSTFKEWTATVAKEQIEFHCGIYDDRIIIRRASGEFTHNGRKFGGK